MGLALVHFPRQDCMSLDWFGQFTASQPFQCLIVSIMNGCARLRFEVIMYNHHHTLTFELWGVTVLTLHRPLRFTPRWGVFGMIQEFHIHSTLTLPLSHYKYNEWYEKVEIDIWALKWPPQHVLSHGWWQDQLQYPTFHTKIVCFGIDSSKWQHLNPSNFSSLV